MGAARAHAVGATVDWPATVPLVGHYNLAVTIPSQRQMVNQIGS